MRRWLLHPISGLGDERGSVSVELVILTPVFIVFLLLAVALGSLVSARINVDGAAAQHVTCAHLGVTVDTSDFQPGGSVAVTVRCSVDLARLTGIGLPVTESVSDRSASPIDRYRRVNQ